jgi:ribosomal protein S18 acetylase RimI-like enzyme
MTARRSAGPGAHRRAPPVRTWRGGDEAAIRGLCCSAAGRDRPLLSYFPDAELFADLMTRYYLERETGSVLVAEDSDGALAGYLLGCSDSRRQRRWEAAWYAPLALARFVARGGLARRATWRLVRVNLPLMLPRGHPRHTQGLLHRYPAHLHIAVEAGVRGRGVGSALVRHFLAMQRREGVAGVHAVVREDNRLARRFFEGMGFEALARAQALRRPPETAPAWKITYGRKTS